MSSNFLKKDFGLPNFSKRSLLMAVFMVLICNVVFLGLAFITKTARPIINADYFLALIFLCLPYKSARILGFLAFVVAIFFDVIMFTMQMFPFMDLSGFIYFLPFIKIAPPIYQGLSLAGVLLVLLFPYILIKLSVKTNLYHLLLVIVPILIFGYFTHHLQYHKRDFQFEIFGANNFYYLNSQIKLYHYNSSQDFIKEMSVEPVLTSYQGNPASEQLKQSDKILFIVNESWGEFKNQELNNKIIEPLLKNKEKFEFFNRGDFSFVGATVNGELRELCRLQVKGFALNLLKSEQLRECLPNVLKAQQYQTIAMHGASGQLYERYDWYLKAGFDELIFAENLMGKKTCQAFRGVCDSEMSDVIKDKFSNHEKLFFYWLTLTTHYPYSPKDLEQDRNIVCHQYHIDDNHLWCGKIKLQQQFFDNLSTLIDNPAMKGVEVMVVGDHIPPADSLLDAQKYLKDNGVSWVHFKIK